MSTSAAEPHGVLDVRPFESALTGAKTGTLLKTDSLQLVRLVILRGKEIPTHSARGEITVHCLEGRVAFTTGGVTYELTAGRLLHVPAGQPHSLLGIEDSSLLVTKTSAPNPGS
jgi:quercetin dioxygenase-like cupin family protein